MNKLAYAVVLAAFALTACGNDPAPAASSEAQEAGSSLSSSEQQTGTEGGSGATSGQEGGSGATSGQEGGSGQSGTTYVKMSEAEFTALVNKIVTQGIGFKDLCKISAGSEITQETTTSFKLDVASYSSEQRTYNSEDVLKYGEVQKDGVLYDFDTTTSSWGISRLVSEESAKESVSSQLSSFARSLFPSETMDDYSFDSQAGLYTLEKDNCPSQGNHSNYTYQMDKDGISKITWSYTYTSAGQACTSTDEFSDMSVGAQTITAPTIAQMSKEEFDALYTKATTEGFSCKANATVVSGATTHVMAYTNAVDVVNKDASQIYEKDGHVSKTIIKGLTQYRASDEGDWASQTISQTEKDSYFQNYMSSLNNEIFPSSNYADYVFKNGIYEMETTVTVWETMPVTYRLIMTKDGVKSVTVSGSSEGGSLEQTATEIVFGQPTIDAPVIVPAGMTKAELSALYKNVCESGLEKLGVSLETKASLHNRAAAALPIEGDPLTDLTSTDYKTALGNMASSICYLDLLGDLYKRSEVSVTDKAMYFHYTSIRNEETDVYLLPTLDEDNGKIYAETIVRTAANDEYLNFDIDYDFANKKVIAYHLCLGLIQQTQTGPSYTYQNQAIGTDNKVYYTTSNNSAGVSTDFKDKLNEKWEDFKTTCETAVFPSGDFNTEFQTFDTNGQKAFYAAFGLN